jgi:outer membrane protein assembly factor BamD (BamD/ComL family)
MIKNREKYLIVLILLAAGHVLIGAETWRLDKGQQWKPVSKTAEGRYLLAVAEIKKLVNEGRPEEVSEALAKLKSDFPEAAGTDLDAFIAAEMLYAEGKFVKSAGKFDRFLSDYPKSALFDAALDRQYAIGTSFLAGQKIRVLKVFKIRGYSQGERIMAKIMDRAGEAPIGKRAARALVGSLEERRKYNEAYQKWSDISGRWPSGRIGRDALLGMARTKHAAYDGPKYDASTLISAKSYYENFKMRYPQDAKRLDIDGRIRHIEEQMAYKQLEIAEYYEKTGSMQSANLYYQMVLDKWPESTAAKVVRQKGIKE